MTITTDKNGSELTVALDGSLDSLTAPELEKTLNKALDGIEKLIFDFKNLVYISSAGLRVITVALEATEGRGGEMTVINVCPDIREVFELTGFIQALKLE